MSVYISIAGKEPTQLCTNKGWSDMIKWIDSLPSRFSELATLAEYGWSQKPIRLLMELDTAKQPADKETQDIVDNLGSLLTGIGEDEPIVISNS